ncbi:hypothetical protein ETH_00012145 [Eimeria tenella]|uniref:Uncharacterized protein n=1 Tax=Eimeria tenella TaxID=5802 RepID=U6KQ99_EIMTE|nr:hypothetical protein ETH_00012145 [Eimeria tenella]CDJ40141.1 hypothetical protein ETH_00012145 [Eimeria tenella]|eukprot:XP_013230894.1 hypothetical protein ETH_00012145 [Eimeria tenella]
MTPFSTALLGAPGILCHGRFPRKVWAVGNVPCEMGEPLTNAGLADSTVQQKTITSSRIMTQAEDVATAASCRPASSAGQFFLAKFSGISILAH